MDIDVNKLTRSQQTIYYKIFENYKDNIKTWTTISGCPGTGKTFLIRNIHMKMNELSIPHYILSPTNMNAKQINGKTIHRAIGGGGNLIDLINVLSKDKFLTVYWSSNNPIKTVQNIDFTARVQTYEKICQVNGKNNKFKLCSANAQFCAKRNNDFIILIDEIGLVSIPLFYYFLYCIPKNTRLIMFGDEHQMQPIGNVNKSLFDLFPRCDVDLIENFVLKENVRHGQNKHFQQFVLDWFNDDRSGTEIPYLSFGGNEIDFFLLRQPKLVICGRDETVQSYKTILLSNELGETINIEPIIKISLISSVRKTNVLDKKHYDKLVDALSLKAGVPVLLNKNIDDNLTYNSILKFEKYDRVTDTIILSKTNILSSFSCDIPSNTINIKRMNTYVERDSLTVYEIDQFPVDLFFATTVHKVQGLTIDFPVLIKHDDFWLEEQDYVAVTRITDENLIYSEYNPILYPKSLQLYLNNNLIKLNKIYTKFCSICKKENRDLQLIERKSTRRLTDETHNINVICEFCLRELDK